MPRLCPICKKALEKKYTWKDILSTIFCFPCVWFCCDRKKTLKCKSCDIEVLISDGTFPLMARTYQVYKDFKWQFSNSPSKETYPFDDSHQTTQSSHLDLHDTEPTNGKSENSLKDTPKNKKNNVEKKESNAEKRTAIEMKDSM